MESTDYSFEQAGDAQYIVGSVAPFPRAQVYRFKDEVSATTWMNRETKPLIYLPIEGYYVYLKFSPFKSPTDPAGWDDTRKLQELAAMARFFHATRIAGALPYWKRYAEK